MKTELKKENNEYSGTFRLSCVMLAIQLVICVGVTFITLKSIIESPVVETRSITSRNYADGVTDALEAVILLDLELRLKNKTRTWGEMRSIIQKRLLGGPGRVNVKELKDIDVDEGPNRSITNMNVAP